MSACASVLLLFFVGPQGWAYQSTCEAWHAGSSTKYFNNFNSGDVITVEVDVDADTLSFFLNGQPGGVVRGLTVLVALPRT